jgi:molecular chaperone IbpA
MVSNLAMDLFNDPFFIGFNRELNRLNNLHKTNSQSYPPYNVRKQDDDTFIVELAIAGFNKESIKVIEHEGTLKIEGERPEVAEEYIHKGIAGRKFTRTFVLGEYMHVDDADLLDGILYVTVKRDVPEEKKPKTIKIK